MRPNGSWSGLGPVTAGGDKAWSIDTDVMILGTSALGYRRPALGGIHPVPPVLQKYLLVWRDDESDRNF